jgi:DNA-binding protein WhiA
VSFSRDVKRELAAIVPPAEHCRRAQLSGLLFGAGTFAMGSGARVTVRLTLSLPAVARHALALLKPFGVEAELRTVSSPLAGRRYEVVLGGERDLQLLNEVGVLNDALQVRMTAPARVVERRCCLVAFLRGLFLGCGTLSSPGAAVHVEFTLEGAGLAEQVRRLLARLELDFRLAERGRNVACYSKRSATAADLLALLGAHDARLRWEEHAVLGEMRGQANRLANCDEANSRRASAAAVRQLDAISALERSGVLELLPPALREMAGLRREYPYSSLVELSTESDLSRSAVSHRLRRLVEAADELHGTIGPPIRSRTRRLQG